MWLKCEICFRKVREHWGNMRKGWLPGFSPFSTMFPNALFNSLPNDKILGLISRGRQSQDCVVKG